MKNPNFGIFTSLSIQIKAYDPGIIVKKTIDSLSKLPDQKLKEVADFAEFMLTKIDDQVLTMGIQNLVSESKTYKFLEDEGDLYTVKDLKEKYK